MERSKRKMKELYENRDQRVKCAKEALPSVMNDLSLRAYKMPYEELSDKQQIRIVRTLLIGTWTMLLQRDDYITAQYYLGDIDAKDALFRKLDGREEK